MNQVRIYGTLGPACADAETLKGMIAEGLTGMRLNLSHTALEDAAPLLDAYRKAAITCGVQPEVLIDMQGPELRIGTLKKPLTLYEGGSIAVAEIPFPAAVRDALADLPVGSDILLDDGKLLLKTERADRLRIVRGGLLKSRKSVALPGIDLQTPAMTDADRRHIAMAANCGVTAVMQPFVRGGADLDAVRRALHAAGSDGIRLLAKIENLTGMQKLSEIIPNCDEIVIARGDLGNAMPLWKLPAAQKRIAAACRASGRDFLVVTQMLDSMMQRAVPTRAEVSDIFNAVLDGASSVMVTGETASGEYPIDAVRYLCKTVREAEAYLQANGISR